jgi:hypothetical protein
VIIWYNKACYTALLGDRDTAIQGLLRANIREHNQKHETEGKPHQNNLREYHEFIKIVEQHVEPNSGTITRPWNNKK